MERYSTFGESFAALAKRPDDPVNFRGHFEAGLLVRAQARAAIRAMELESRVVVVWRETKGLLSSYFTYRVSGKSSDVREALGTMRRLLPEEG